MYFLFYIIITVVLIRFSEPYRTTLNSQSCDRRQWKNLGVDSTLAKNANSVGDAYLDLGCELSFTCAPYLLPSKPKMGENIIWGESNAVVYSNSVSEYLCIHFNLELLYSILKSTKTPVFR